ncbi:MAG: hypothetical protein U0271_10840 [Polyangiaceae bacterium]
MVAHELANIDDTTIAKRLRFGVLAFAAALALVTLVRELDAHAAWAALSVVPFFLAFSLLYHGLFRTCPYLAKRGARNLGDGEETIAERADLEALRTRGRRVGQLALASAVSAAALAVLAMR